MGKLHAVTWFSMPIARLKVWRNFQVYPEFSLRNSLPASVLDVMICHPFEDVLWCVCTSSRKNGFIHSLIEWECQKCRPATPQCAAANSIELKTRQNGNVKFVKPKKKKMGEKRCAVECQLPATQTTENYYAIKLRVIAYCIFVKYTHLLEFNSMENRWTPIKHLLYTSTDWRISG